MPAPALAEPLMDALSLWSIACCPILLAPRRAVCVVSPPSAAAASLSPFVGGSACAAILQAAFVHLAHQPISHGFNDYAGSVAQESFVLLLSWEPTPAQLAAAMGALYARNCEPPCAANYWCKRCSWLAMKITTSRCCVVNNLKPSTGKWLRLLSQSGTQKRRSMTTP